MSYVYKFIDEHENIIYVGRTDDLYKRLTYKHFTKQGHLPKICYDKCYCVETAEVKSTNESRIYELYLISKYRPEFNATYIDGGELTFDLPNLNWVRHYCKEENNKRELACATVEEVTEILDKFDEIVEDLSKDIKRSVHVIKEFGFLNGLDEEKKKAVINNLNSIEKKANIIRYYRLHYKKTIRGKIKIYDERTRKEAR